MTARGIMCRDNLLDINTLREEVTHQIVDFIIAILDVHVIRILDICVSSIVGLVGMAFFNFASANNRMEGLLK